MSKQEECNKCKTAGFPNQLIGFKKSNRINPASGKAFWDLINIDGSEHVHKDKTAQNGNPVIDATTIVKPIETLTESVSALVFALCATTDEQRSLARGMVNKR